jgi:AraC-like DNA-binding protein
VVKAADNEREKMTDEQVDPQTVDDAVDEYPADPPDDFDGPGNVPPLRSAGVRKKVLQTHPVTNRTKKVGKSPSRILAQEKRRKALELRKTGATYDQIAQFVGYNDGSAARKAVIKAFGQVIQEPVAEVRVIQIERLNHMLMTLWPKVNQVDENAIRTSLAVMDKIDALMGTEAARQVEVTNTGAVLVVDGNKDDYLRALKKMAGISSDGHNVSPGQARHALPPGHSTGVVQTDQGPLYPPGMSGTVDSGVGDEDSAFGGRDVVDAELVEDSHEHPRTEDTSGVHPATPTQRKFSFGVDPTVRR